MKDARERELASKARDEEHVSILKVMVSNGGSWNFSVRRFPRKITIHLFFSFQSKDTYRVALLVAVAMHLSQQLSGMVAIFYYSTGFFVNAGVKEDNAQYATLGVGAIMVAMTFVTIPLMDRLGRRTLHLGGLAGIVVFCILITVAQNLDPQENDGIGVFLIVSTLGFVVFFALGPGSIPWLITGELFKQVWHCIRNI